MKAISFTIVLVLLFGFFVFPTHADSPWQKSEYGYWFTNCQYFYSVTYHKFHTVDNNGEKGVYQSYGYFGGNNVCTGVNYTVNFRSNSKYFVLRNGETIASSVYKSKSGKETFQVIYVFANGQLRVDHYKFNDHTSP